MCYGHYLLVCDIEVAHTKHGSVAVCAAIFCDILLVSQITCVCFRPIRNLEKKIVRCSLGHFIYHTRCVKKARLVLCVCSIR